MKKHYTTLGATALLFMAGIALGACNADDAKPSVHLNKQATSRIINNQNQVVGEAVYTQGSHGVLIDIEARGLPAGKHGMHFHEVGTCDDHDSFMQAKGHIMPSQKPHGYLNPEGPHEGNLPNLVVHEDGTVQVELYTELVSLYGDQGKPALLDTDGSVLMIHTNPDDHLTQPIGGAGARIACGVVQVLQEENSEKTQ